MNGHPYDCLTSKKTLRRFKAADIDHILIVSSFEAILTLVFPNASVKALQFYQIHVLPHFCGQSGPFWSSVDQIQCCHSSMFVCPACSCRSESACSTISLNQIGCQLNSDRAGLQYTLTGCWPLLLKRLQLPIEICTNLHPARELTWTLHAKLYWHSSYHISPWPKQTDCSKKAANGGQKSHSWRFLHWPLLSSCTISFAVNLPGKQRAGVIQFYYTNKTCPWYPTDIFWLWGKLLLGQDLRNKIIIILKRWI